MKGIRPRVFFAVGLLASGLLAALVARTMVGLADLLADRKAFAEARGRTRLVVPAVPSRDLAAGVKVGREDFTFRAVPEQLLTRSVVRPEQIEYVVDSVLAVPVTAGEPLRWSDFSLPASLEGASAVAHQACVVALRRSGRPESVQAGSVDELGEAGMP